MPWVPQLIQKDNSFSLDILDKNRKYNGMVNSLLQEFYYATPEVMLKFVEVYATSLYGSQVWDISSKDYCKLVTSWNVLIRQILYLDRRTHRFLIEPLSGCKHLETVLYSRMLKFSESLESHMKFSLRFLHSLNKRDLRTVYGNNLQTIRDKFRKQFDSKEEPSSKQVKQGMKYWVSDDKEILMTKCVIELQGVMTNELIIPGFNTVEIEEMFHNICIS